MIGLGGGSPLDTAKAVAVLSVLLSATTVLLLSTVSGAHYLLAQAIATLLTLCGGYALNKRWAFRRRAA